MAVELNMNDDLTESGGSLFIRLHRTLFNPIESCANLKIVKLYPSTIKSAICYL